MNPLRVAVIGCGVIGPLHMKCYAHNANAKLVAVCDLVADKARKAVADLGLEGVRVETDAAAVFAASDIDAVSICTDHASHAALACAALAAGKHVLCEKCLAVNRTDLNDMLAAAHAHPAVTAAAIFQHRFEPLFRAAKAALDEGALGTLLGVVGSHHCWRGPDYFAHDNWRGTQAGEGGSVLINQSIHFFDEMLWLSGGAKRALGFTANRAKQGVIEVEDTAAGAFELNDGALATFLCTNSSHHGWLWRIQFAGTEGAFTLQDDRAIDVSCKDPARQEALRARFEQAAADAATAKGKDYYGGGHQAQIDDFIDAVLDHRRPFVTFDDAAQTASTLFALYEQQSV